MNSNFTKQIAQLENNDQVMRAIRERRDEILGAIGDRTVDPSEELMRELFDLNIALGEGDYFTAGAA